MSKKQILLAYICSLVICIKGIQFNPIEDGNIDFIILHNNDMHARFEQTSANSGKCTEDLKKTNKCYGGFARVAYEVRKYRQKAENGGTPVLYLNAGDTYSGTPWFTIFNDKIAADFLNELNPDAISLGNHELDNNVLGLVPFLKQVNFPVLASNLDLRNVPELAGANNLFNSTVLHVKDVQIGVIGYLTPDTKNLAPPNGIKFLDEIEAINKESSLLKAQGINIIIALGHSGYDKVQEIALKCPEVDLVIGGHTNTFLYNGAQPDAESIKGPYPTKVIQDSGKEVPVLQAYAYTKNLGKLHVKFDRSGNLIEYKGTPILLNAEIPRAPDVVQLLEKYRPNITEFETRVVGHSKVLLDGRREMCRRQECNLGNLITDALIYARVLEYQNDLYWTDAAIAFLWPEVFFLIFRNLFIYSAYAKFIYPLGIRNSFDLHSNGTIFASDILLALPFGNDFYMTKISGKTLLKNLEHAASMEENKLKGGFLQLSGVRTTYDYNKEIGNRVISIKLRCAECNVPKYEPLDNNKLYNVIVPEFLLKGGDGHYFSESNGFKSKRLLKTDYEAVLQYLDDNKIIFTEVGRRITIIPRTENDNTEKL